MHKKLISAISIGLILIQVVPTTSFAVNKANYKNNITRKESTNNSLISPNKKDIIPVVFNPDTMQDLDRILESLDKLNLDFSKSLLIDIFNMSVNLHTNLEDSEIQKHKDYDQFDYIFFQLIYLAFVNTNGSERNELFIKFMDEMYLSSVKRLNSNDKYSFFLDKYGLYIGYQLSDYFKDERTNKILKGGASMFIELQNFTPTEETGKIPEDELPSSIEPTKPDGDDNPNKDEPPIYIPDKIPDDEFNPGGNNNNGTPDNYDPSLDNGLTPGNSSDLTSDEYVKENNSCTKITTIYDLNGNIVNKKKTKAQNGFCNIFNSNIVTGEVWNRNHNGDLALNVWQSLNENELNKESNLTLKFTLNKNDKNIYYYDSGINVNLNKTVTYNQVRDVLNQIALKIKNGYLIEDKKKLLFIAEGKPLVVEDKKSSYSEAEIKGLLNTFNNLSLKIEEKDKTNEPKFKDEKQNSSLDKIFINNKEVKLKHPAMLKNGIIQLPIEEIAKELKIKLKINKNLAILSDNNSITEYYIGTKKIKINGAEKLTTTSSKLENNIIYAEMNAVLREFGFSINFNASTNKISILKK
ncbi:MULTISPECIES: stalk domain-containing protein [unclassified Clostridioides]|uniref:stalk domain-containing protein n=1 Tax=unclassified Clostridioides TaxID=2635829 RepID=UPI001D11CDC7|nr:hypothetical protein [Clostridioides sp. ES-S-0145-01]MCC0681952.1 hypothetical protein [Clostridioides sp. ES-S-0005-03]MCC0709301.1 hypothetical protein [Clostridioides sp. ES-S-0190-01]UDN64144.1 hypothetical protein IC758_19935 [Clostridioides sp. ES-W-0016-02]